MSQAVPSQFPLSFFFSSTTQQGAAPSRRGRHSLETPVPDVNTRDLQEKIVKCLRLPDRTYLYSQGVGLAPAAAREDLWRGLMHTIPVVEVDWQQGRSFHLDYDERNSQPPQPVSSEGSDTQQAGSSTAGAPA
ncbi:hypothetical protein Pmar_PMAR020041 [Perkinsus marinus ATCC 50983]|uniref:Uncharacterized protein n=1 Tax=Perkinsus marinus (strain ATCC 50983 / TXsc) TaxID=423536 RepID=C5L0J9_PERM5|nr:hypothetical protein Pmar_PMAR020041 [Perkinsus marinus ATCC 50983]EER09747.1 hypothetical protein Pmar_PMAR020041 [Perkinsus marinus ATCC 50983]|eukprot:XP_002777952.1 hypothetical protein Pmar_PMAR020041 [Perkinsus marinus ATCC 50983]